LRRRCGGEEENEERGAGRGVLHRDRRYHISGFFLHVFGMEVTWKSRCAGQATPGVEDSTDAGLPKRSYRIGITIMFSAVELNRPNMITIGRSLA
jgi:hypothetical protein